ncbi:hypothetical protein SDC9_211649 [bioreactor metagenome]|uniref:Uncharacterized protein n=1 Tax=bioreactor metagenome TaxID=1076179 RepID=A0A645JKV3_9ZZZZ
MDGRRGGPQTHAVASSLLDDFRLLQSKFLSGGDYDAVPGFPYLGKGVGNPAVFLLHDSQFGEQRHQIAVIPHVEA